MSYNDDLDNVLEWEAAKRRKWQQDAKLEELERENAVRAQAIERYRGMDEDNDGLDDGLEIRKFSHNDENKPIHKMNGVSTKGPALVRDGKIEFPYSSHAVDLSVRKPAGTGGSGKMKLGIRSPRKMPLTVDFGEQRSHHKHTLSMGDSIRSPHNYRMDTRKAGNINIGGAIASMEASSKRVDAKHSAFSKKFSSEHSVKRGSEKNESHDSINKLVGRLNGFVQKPKVSKVNSKPNAAKGLVDGLNFSTNKEKREENALIEKMNSFVSLNKKRRLY